MLKRAYLRFAHVDHHSLNDRRTHLASCPSTGIACHPALFQALTSLDKAEASPVGSIREKLHA